MNQLLCIVGPTGTGKTKRAVEELRKQPSIIVSADSRQVYRGMDIVTGKDHPKDIQIFGINIVNPNESCSVSVWHDAVRPHIQTAWEEGKQVIVVGGTGLYVKAITEGIATMSIPINQPLRDELEPLTVNELQTKLSALDPIKYQSMNHSDQFNPRRLVRAIEVAFSRSHIPRSSKTSNISAKIIGLRCIDDSNHRYKIIERVKKRLESGAVEETKSLLAKYDPSLQPMSAIGYRSIISFLENKISEDEMLVNWVNDELAYAKRQLTWFRKQPVIWYDIDTYGITED